MLRTIMTETGQSPHALAAMETALWLARSFGARLQVLTCLDERTVQDAHIRQMVEEQVRERQDEFAQRAQAAGVRCVTDLEVGDRRSALVHLSRKADLLVLGGSPKRDSPSAGFAGGAASLARELVRSVLFVRHPRPTFGSIVVGYGGGENSCTALQLAAHFAEKAQGTVHIVTSQHDLIRAHAILNVGVSYLEAYQVRAVPHHCEEEPSSAILDVAEDAGAGLVAVGAYRRGTLHAVAFGSTALRILEWSPAAVLVCR